MTKTLQECKEIIANENGWATFDELQNNESLKCTLNMLDLANKIYYDQFESENERLIKEIEDRVVKCILDDIDFGYDLATIKGKIKSGSYVGNSPETFKENERLKSELLGNPEQLKAEMDKILDEVKAEIVEKFDADPMVRRISNMVINEIKSRITP